MKRIQCWMTASLVAIAACGSNNSDASDVCLAELPAQCTPTLDPTYNELFDKVFSARCGGSSTGTFCHGQAGLRGGLGLYEPNQAYEALLGHGPDQRARVIPGEPLCSVLMERLETSDAARRMPLGEAALADGVRCAIQQWIANGAAR
jgi:hypothetical protein